MSNRKFQIQDVPFDAWPAIEQERFETGAKSWSARQRKIATIARSRFLGLVEKRGLSRRPTRHGFDEYKAALLASLSPRKTREHLQGLHAVCGILYPGHDWSWMPAVYAHMLRSFRVQERTVKKPRRIRGLPIEEWPAPIREAWELAMSPHRHAEESFATGLDSDVMAALGNRPIAASQDAHDNNLAAVSRRKDPSKWAATTVRDLRYKLGVYLATLRELDRPLEFTEEQFVAVISATEPHVTPMSLWSFAHALSRIAVALWPEEDWSWLRRHVTLLREERDRHASPKKARRAVPAVRLVELAEELIAKAEAGPPKKDKAVAFRDGMMILVLVEVTPRLSNLHDTERGRTIHFDADTMKGTVHYPTTKNGRPLFRELSANLIEVIDRWWNHFRPLLATGESGDCVWLSRSGRPMTPETITWAMRDRTRRALGVAISPQAVRNIVAASVAENLPYEQAFDIASYQLNHRSKKSVLPYIEHAPHYTATRALAEALDFMRTNVRSERT